MMWVLFPLFLAAGGALGCAIGVYGVADHAPAPFVAIAATTCIGAVAGIAVWAGWML